MIIQNCPEKKYWLKISYQISISHICAWFEEMEEEQEETIVNHLSSLYLLLLYDIVHTKTMQIIDFGWEGEIVFSENNQFDCFHEIFTQI